MTIERVFVLGTGRCGTRTWAAACQHLPGWTVGHESRGHLLDGRLDYPPKHIEVDNRLVWFAGSLIRRYGGPGTLWVHLQRDLEATARSLTAVSWRGKHGIMPAFAQRIVRGKQPDRLDAARLYVETVNDQIAAVLAGQWHTIDARIEDPHKPFNTMCDLLGVMEGRDAGHAELDVRHGEGGKRGRGVPRPAGQP